MWIEGTTKVRNTQEVAKAKEALTAKLGRKPTDAEILAERQVAEAIETLTAKLGRKPTDAEILAETLKR